MASSRHWLPSKPASRQPQLQQQSQNEQSSSLIESSIANHHQYHPAYTKPTPQQQHHQQQLYYQQYSTISASIYQQSHHSIQPVQDHNFNLLENLPVPPSNNKDYLQHQQQQLGQQAVQIQHHQALATAAKVSLLDRDDGIQQRDAARLMLLRIELHRLSLRRKRNSIIDSIKINGGSLDRPQIDLNRLENNKCARCGIDLGRIVNRGAPCRLCKFKVCKSCREFIQVRKSSSVVSSTEQLIHVTGTNEETTTTTKSNSTSTSIYSTLNTSGATNDWICIVCYKRKQIEMKSAKSDWVDNFSAERPRRASVTREYLPLDDPKKSIKRSWTISTPDNDTMPTTRNGVHYGYTQGTTDKGSYPSLIRAQPTQPQLAVQKPFASEEVVYEGPTSPRRILRQSTMPNPEVYYPSNPNLLLSVSPNQQRSPQYSPYHTDNENDDDQRGPSPTPNRYSNQIRRQSTLPCKPNEPFAQLPPMYLSTSPNRNYSRSPERPAPFVRQSTFPAQGTTDTLLHIPRQLPTSPNRLGFVKSPDSGPETDYIKPLPLSSSQMPSQPPQLSPQPLTAKQQRAMKRQVTLPNPDNQLKVMTTSPPRQLSPGYRKVSPEFVRQNTVPAITPEPINSVASAISGSSNTLAVHGPKFLPISPRAKQSFLFPQPGPTPRPFLSQQHFPVVSDEPQSDARELQRQQSKMIKVRSHSNEEYSINRLGQGQVQGQPPTTEGRRMLPEIPPNRSPKLVRQAHVKEELIRNNSSTEKRSPVYKTFNEAKQQVPGITDDYSAPAAVNPNTITTKAVISSQQIMATSGGGVVSGNGTSSATVTGAAATNSIYYPDMENVNVNYGDETVISSDNYGIKSYDDQKVHPLMSIDSQAAQFYGSDDFTTRPQSIRRTRRKSRELPEPPVQKLHLHLQQQQQHQQQQQNMYQHGQPMVQPLQQPQVTQATPAQQQQHHQQPLQTVASSQSSSVVVAATAVVAKSSATETGAVPKTYNEGKCKPETMRSISEESSAAKNAKPTTRRSMSHPEKPEATNTTSDLSKPLEPERKWTFAEILAEKKRQEQQARRRNFKSSDSSLSPVKSHPLNATLEKQDSSKSFDAVIKKVIMNERLKKIDSQDENKSQSMDERMFVDNNIRKASKIIDEVDTDALFKKISSTSEKTLHKDQLKSTLGEAEIQSAVEHAAVIFKKVVVQKRAKKLADEGGDTRWRTADDRKGDLFWPVGDDYQLVFISSESSSSRDDDNDDSASTTSSQPNSINYSDECDWDYFEPGAPSGGNNSVGASITYTGSKFSSNLNGSPIVARRLPLQHRIWSPMASPLMVRRGLSESPTREVVRGSGSEDDEGRSGSDGILYQSRSRKHCHEPVSRQSSASTCSCGGTTYVPIPVPVPIIVPISTKTEQMLLEDVAACTNINLRAIQEQLQQSINNHLKQNNTQLYAGDTGSNGSASRIKPVVSMQQQQQEQHSLLSFTTSPSLYTTDQMCIGGVAASVDTTTNDSFESNINNHTDHIGQRQQQQQQEQHSRVFIVDQEQQCSVFRNTDYDARPQQYQCNRNVLPLQQKQLVDINAVTTSTATNVSTVVTSNVPVPTTDCKFLSNVSTGLTANQSTFDPSSSGNSTERISVVTTTDEGEASISQRKNTSAMNTSSTVDNLQLLSTDAQNTNSTVDISDKISKNATSVLTIDDDNDDFNDQFNDRPAVVDVGTTHNTNSYASNNVVGQCDTVEDSYSAEAVQQHTRNMSTSDTIVPLAGVCELQQKAIHKNSRTEDNEQHSTDIDISATENSIINLIKNTKISENSQECDLPDQEVLFKDNKYETMPSIDDTQGYLISESCFSSDSSPSDTDTEENSGKRVERSYDVVNASKASNKIFLSDNEEEDDAESSVSAPSHNLNSDSDEDSSDDSEIEDEDEHKTRLNRKPKQKQKRFTKVFVVNRGDDSSDDSCSTRSLDTSSDTDSNDDDSSDNDTDIDRDCNIVLNYVRNFSDDDRSDDNRPPPTLSPAPPHQSGSFQSITNSTNGIELLQHRKLSNDEFELSVLPIVLSNEKIESSSLCSLDASSVDAHVDDRTTDGENKIIDEEAVEIEKENSKQSVVVQQLTTSLTSATTSATRVLKELKVKNEAFEAKTNGDAEVVVYAKENEHLSFESFNDHLTIIESQQLDKSGNNNFNDDDDQCRANKHEEYDEEENEQQQDEDNDDDDEKNSNISDDSLTITIVEGNNKLGHGHSYADNVVSETKDDETGCMQLQLSEGEETTTTTAIKPSPVIESIPFKHSVLPSWVSSPAPSPPLSYISECSIDARAEETESNNTTDDDDDDHRQFNDGLCDYTDTDRTQLFTNTTTNLLQTSDHDSLSTTHTHTLPPPGVLTTTKTSMDTTTLAKTNTSNNNVGGTAALAATCARNVIKTGYEVNKKQVIEALPHQQTSLSTTTSLDDQSDEFGPSKCADGGAVSCAIPPNNNYSSNFNPKYTSLVMITQGLHEQKQQQQQHRQPTVNIVATDTTHVVGDDSVIVKHTNSEPGSPATANNNTTLHDYFTLSLEQNSPATASHERRVVKITTAPTTTGTVNKNKNQTTTSECSAMQANEVENLIMNKRSNNKIMKDVQEKQSDYDVKTSGNSNSVLDTMAAGFSEKTIETSDGHTIASCESLQHDNDVTVITGENTLSAVVCLEDGLADDDSWVEEVSQDEDDFGNSIPTDSDLDSSEELALMSLLYRDDDARNRVSLDFTLHTIVEESCEESEVESYTPTRPKNRLSASELEKYFFYGLGNNEHASASTDQNTNRDDFVSETSSICSEGPDSLGPSVDEQSPHSIDNNDLASSRLEKYFLSGFMGFNAENASDGSGSVGSDSEGQPSPEQRRKRLLRIRGTGRSHSSSLDNLLDKEDSDKQDTVEHNQIDSNDSSETECEEPVTHAISDVPFDTAKRKKRMAPKKPDEVKLDDFSRVDSLDNDSKVSVHDLPHGSNLAQSTKHCSRDSGFIGSNDDLLKEDVKSPELRLELEEIEEESKLSEKEESNPTESTSQLPLSRKDSFNNWSSDEETNLMMSKMRQFFKTLIAASANAQNMANSKSSTPLMSEKSSPKQGLPRRKPPQLVYFESELTRLMKTVPGIRDDQVREIVEYLSSEDTWSDSYDSSDYTSSDLENGTVPGQKSELQKQISDSCQEIINKFDVIGDEEGDMGDGGLLVDEPLAINKETAIVYQKLVASLSKISTGDEKPASETNSPPLIAKVINHIGSRLVALMHEVSSGESLASCSPRSGGSRFHRKLHQKISATTTEDDDSNTSDTNLDKIDDYLNLPRSKSHDLLLSESKPSHQYVSMSGGEVGSEEKGEASDYERFSWRGSFESALLAPNDSRTKLTNIENANSPASVLAAKRRSAGDLLFNYKSLSREQLDRVRSCGSIGGDDIEANKLWGSQNPHQKPGRRRSSINNCDTDESSDDAEHRLASGRSTLPRSLCTGASPASTNSLPRLHTSTQSSSMQKSQSVHQILSQNNVKSARYRAPGFNRTQVTAPKRAVSAPGLQPMYIQRRDRRKLQSHVLEEANSSDATNSPLASNRNLAQTTNATSPIGSIESATSDPWPSQSDEDIDRLVANYQGRQNSLCSLGVRSDSMASVYSGAGEGRYGTVTVKGQIEIGLQYNYKHSALEIMVKQCKDLAAVDTKRNRSDPYVKVYLLPDKSKTGKRKTKVKKHTLNPVFDETLRFFTSLSALESRTLWLTVWHSDMFGRNDFLGEVLMPLQGKVFDSPQPQWYNLQERSEPFEDLPVYKGDIIVGLKFIPPDSSSSSSSGTTPHSTPKGGSLNLRKFSVKSSSSSSRNSKGALHVLVKEAKNLSAVKASGTCDAFCKSYLLPDKSRSTKQKTCVIKRSTNPVWNHTFVYEDVSLQDLSERALELTIWDHDRLASNEFLGGVRFSLGTNKHNGKLVDWMDATGKELNLWQSMLNRPNFWVEGCLTLRSSLDNARIAT